MYSLNITNKFEALHKIVIISEVGGQVRNTEILTSKSYEENSCPDETKVGDLKTSCIVPI